MNDEPFAPFGEGPQACPFVAFEDDRDRRSDRPDYRHRCFASPQPEPRAFPHQERYCLSPEFTACPIFLDWARRESAGVVAARRSASVPSASSPSAADSAAAGAAGGLAASSLGGVSNAAPAPLDAADEPVLPPFLSGRSRPSSRQRDEEYEDEEPNPDEGLWGADPGQSRYAERSDPSAYGRQPEAVTGTARANASHPEWERPRSGEQYPRLSRGERRNLGRVGNYSGGGSRNNSFLLVALLILVAIMAALVVVPSLLPKSGTGGSGSSSKPTATVKASHSASAATPTPSPSPKTYTVKSGDTMTSIAKKLGVTVDDLLAANPQIKNPDQIAIGDVLNIPGASPAPGTSPSAGSTASETPLP